jgi:hypothetical protein
MAKLKTVGDHQIKLALPEGIVYSNLIRGKEI